MQAPEASAFEMRNNAQGELLRAFGCQYSNSMLDSMPPYFVWSLWPYLSNGERLLLFALAALSFYSIYCVAATVISLRQAGREVPGENNASVQRTLMALRRQPNRLHKLTGVAFYLFGTLFFLQLQSAYWILGDSRVPLASLVLMNFKTHFAFAFNVFPVFLVLHLLRWFVENRIDAYSRKLRDLTSAEL